MTFVPERYEKTEVLVFQEVGKCSIISNKRVGWIERVGRTFFFHLLTVRAIISPSRFEAAHVYKPRILSFKKESRNNGRSVS